MINNLTKQELIQFIANVNQTVLNQFLELQTIMQNYQLYVPVAENLATNAINAAKATIDIINNNVALTNQDIINAKQQKLKEKQPFQRPVNHDKIPFDNSLKTDNQDIPFTQNIHKDGVQPTLIQGKFNNIGDKDVVLKREDM